MAYNEKLTNRVREALGSTPNLEEKKMFRGVTFMVNGKMCVSVGDDDLMCRFDPSLQDTIVKKAGCREMIQGGKTMKGFVFVSEEVLKTKKDLAFWLKLSLDFNTSAKASKAKRNLPQITYYGHNSQTTQSWLRILIPNISKKNKSNSLFKNVNVSFIKAV